MFRAIQTKLGLPATGVADAATLGGIARWQAQHRMDPIEGQSEAFARNGIASPNVLQHLFPTGLARPEVAQAFVRDLKKEVARWPVGQHQDVMRLQGAERVLNEALQRAGVPGVRLVIGELGDTTNAQFDRERWVIVIDDDLFPLGKGAVSQEVLGNLIQTLYHEARHAEQNFASARLAAGRKQALPQKMSPQALKAAIAKPLPAASIEGIKAAAIYDSVLGKSARSREQVYANLDESSADVDRLSDAIRHLVKQQTDLEIASYYIPAQDQKALQANEILYAKVTKQLLPLRAAYQAALNTNSNAYRQYRMLPEEADAWRQGEKAKRIFEGKR
ncbi:hypothetical protein [Deinococcus multiflagellatus]|uniref:Uncharacterized protein n=1 Tax=Deinococcus multiflagellatus TaxID=1656887 RepID=A0ABW1ZND5_9DEIO|nr:hypothetical protein [Deinococcus multiflagellatus]MBZ9712349.1 hypothetical protein [Deinococcus multiflagellatus]